MPAYLLTYKTNRWPKEKMDGLVERFNADPSGTTELWRLKAREAKLGDRVFLFRQGSGPRGIFGVGEIIETPRVQIDPNNDDKTERRSAKIKFQALVNPAVDFLLKFESIRDLSIDNLIKTHASGIKVPDHIAAEIERRLPQAVTARSELAENAADDTNFNPYNLPPEYEWAWQIIRIRRGQSAFRIELIAAYEGRCAISDCAVVDVLEAAHITPYKGPHTNHVSNGLLLRADLHTLFDCGLISIEPVSRCVVVSKKLEGSCYAKLEGCKLRSPKNPNHRPSNENLELRHMSLKIQQS